MPIKSKMLSLLLLSLLSVCSQINAAIITDGLTFSVASDMGLDLTVGNHFHSHASGNYGTHVDVAEVGTFLLEEVRGMSEFDLSGMSEASSAYIEFQAYGYGLYEENNRPFDGIVSIDTYEGNNQEDISDYQRALVDHVASFSTVGLVPGMTTIRSYVTRIFNDALINGWSSLGIRLSSVDGMNDYGGAWVFNDFKLVSNDASTAVPEPSTILLISMGLIGFSGLISRQAKA
jgi:hypothetical protein